MVNKRMRAQAMLSLVRKAARKNDIKVVELPGRGKGSHHIYALRDSEGVEVGRFGITDHGSKDVSMTVLEHIEDALAHLFGEKWTEKK